MDERMERMEGMLSQLNSSVCNLNEMVGNIKIENEQRHKELLAKLKNLELDQEYIWEKAVRNEREIARIVKQRS
ncbi:hypothetical protein FZC84_21080 [Rossellomorea vietnamensis]|uniref:Uncharacterized protein n=1 Tax=Rossellomorea vietnamensis TaxID=218284 RepID=A0A5D4M4D8_9BACI|nr:MULTISPECIES: hypothetical protein [Bacillaceae]TYR95925.1 hypothetical protein FZC84_21080 [Rossellomorea vietnamensis]